MTWFQDFRRVDGNIRVLMDLFPQFLELCLETTEYHRESYDTPPQKFSDLYDNFKDLVSPFEILDQKTDFYHVPKRGHRL